MGNFPAVNELRLEIGGKIFWFKIGLRGIIYLQSLPEINVEGFFIAGILTLQPEMSSLAIQRLWQSIDDTSVIEAMYNTYHPSFFNVRDLYSQIVGELGISPAIFFQMSLEECELAYQGYLRRQALTANLNKLAYMQALAGNYDEINILPTLEYNDGDIKEREQTFAVLGMNDNDNT